jgi:hypothetical protein
LAVLGWRRTAPGARTVSRDKSLPDGISGGLRRLQKGREGRLTETRAV